MSTQHEINTELLKTVEQLMKNVDGLIVLVGMLKKEIDELKRKEEK